MKALFTKKYHQTADVWSFDFASAEPISWQAGQSVRLEIPGDYGPIEHRFSIAAAPSMGIITITTRLSGSDYKESLAALTQGSEVQLYAIEGNFTWHNVAKPLIFVAAGIGITPIFAMLAEQAAQKLPLTATLLYYGRDNPPLYKNQLAAWRQNGLAVQWCAQRITAADITSLASVQERLIYLSGPSKMVDALYADLIAAGIPPANILRDQFTGRLSLDG